MLRYTGSVMSDGPAARVGETADGDSSESVGYSAAVGAAYRLVSVTPCPPAPSPLVRKLQNQSHLSDDEIAAITELSAASISCPSGQVLVHEGRTPDYVYLLIRGMGCRYKLLPGGQRQILGYLIPLDLFDLRFGPSTPSDHSVVLLSESLVLRIPIRRMTDLLMRFPRIERALTLLSLLDLAILREWLLNVGQRNAFQKLSHFFCEMSVRLSAVGQVRDDGSFELPINQATLADTTGLTCVHINRTLQRLRSEGLVALSHRRLSILDFDRLAAIAGFDDAYLRPAPWRH